MDQNGKETLEKKKIGKMKTPKEIKEIVLVTIDFVIEVLENKEKELETLVNAKKALGGDIISELNQLAGAKDCTIAVLEYKLKMMEEMGLGPNSNETDTK